MKRTQVLGRKAVIVTGARTPFVKSFGEFTKVDTIGLSSAAVGGLLAKSKLDPKELNHIIWGNVDANECAELCP